MERLTLSMKTIKKAVIIFENIHLTNFFLNSFRSRYRVPDPDFCWTKKNVAESLVKSRTC